MTGQITLSGSGMDIRIEWKISHFFQQINEVKSPKFHIFNCECALLVVPRKRGFVCMELLKFSGPDISGECVMGIKKADGSETETEKTEILLLGELTVTGNRKLISVNDLLSSRNTMAPGDCLTVFCNAHFSEDFSDPFGLGPPSTIIGRNIEYWLPASTSFQEEEDIKRKRLSDWSSSSTSFQEEKGIKRKRLSDCSSCSTSFQEEKGIATFGDSGVSEAISVLTENFRDLYLQQSHTDVIIKVKNKEFPAHKLILIARSKVFASMFEHDSSEKRSGIVEIADCDPDSFEDFLLFLYTADLKTVSSRNVVGLYKTSDKYGCKELLKECVRCMVQEVSMDTFFDYFPLATMHNESDLLTAVTNFFIKNAKTILPTTKWLALMEEHPSLCNELLIKFANTV